MINKFPLFSSPVNSLNWMAFAFFFALIISVAAFFEGLENMTDSWATDEYSHAVMIPFISLFLAFQRFPDLVSLAPRARYASVFLAFLSVIFLVAGEFSALNTLVQYGFLTALTGVVVSFIGINGLVKMWVPIVYLIFMIPLPTIIQNNLSNELQLISSSIGVMVVRLFGISVFLEGNVIDLGAMKLQVVDACSGLRYLFPLMSFGFLVAAIYNERFWIRLILFFSTIPIAVLMNSFRIGVIGVTVEWWEIGAAEGFLHDFEGWVVFVSCLAVLVCEMYLINSLRRSSISVIDRLNLTLPSPLIDRKYFSNLPAISFPQIFVVFILLFGMVGLYYHSDRTAIPPARKTFNLLPLYHQEWVGREGRLTEDILDNLKLSDYFIADYSHSLAKVPVNFYLAYYENQNKGATIHSPKSCIPGGGWEIKQFDTVRLEDVSHKLGRDFQVNRVVIQKGEARSIVYYWFQQQGRIVTNEFLNRGYIFLDAFLKGRSDGALIRVSAPWVNGSPEQVVDQSLEAFIMDFSPIIPPFLPD